MMKSRFLILSVLCLFSFTLKSGQGEYFIINQNPNFARYFHYGKKSYVEYFLDKKQKMGPHEYSVRIRKYSWGDIDTAYYRMDEEKFYHYNKLIRAESIVIPRSPVINQQWFESDSSWVYTIIKTGQTLQTPLKKYKNCVIVECRQLTGRDPEKSQGYYLYYSKGNGYVGNINDKGVVLSYLKEIVKNASEGAKIGEE